VREFGGDPGILGQALSLNDRSFEIVGVMPPRFGFPIPTTEIYVPYPTEPPADLQPGQVRLELVQVVGRLRDGVGIEQAEEEAEQAIEEAQARLDATRAEIARQLATPPDDQERV